MKKESENILKVKLLNPRDLTYAGVLEINDKRWGEGGYTDNALLKGGFLLFWYCVWLFTVASTKDKWQGSKTRRQFPIRELGQGQHAKTFLHL